MKICPIDMFLISPEFVSSLGLGLDIIGAFMIFKYGLSENVSRSGSVGIIAEQEDEEEIELAKLYDKRSRNGIACLVTGFLLQIISNWL